MAISAQPGEEARLAALARYAVLDTPPEFPFDALTELAAQICDCPAALIGLIDERREFLKAKYGLPPELTECPRDITICSQTLSRNDLLYIPDTMADERCRNLGTVAGEPHVRFYCGMPLINSEGYALGTLCVIDFTAHEISAGQQEAIRQLARQAVAQLELRRQLIERNEMLRALEEARTALIAEKDKADSLLLDILPAAIAEELKRDHRVEPRYYESASVIFTDFENFTHLTEQTEPAGLIGELDRVFSCFDEIAARNRVEKLKTIGDAYLCVGGVPVANRSHPIDACLAALQIRAATARANRARAKLHMRPWPLRIGIHTGPLIAGVVGRHKFTFDIWGDTVNLAERMEAACPPDEINISDRTCLYVAALFETEPRGSVAVKNKGPLPMHYLRRIRPEFSADEAGTLPNDLFWLAAHAANHRAA
ncbi:class 3 adenylate cyclase [Chelatococcus caeni]|uniref:Class 3 adenylate cyclase n=1 Tax=Chelatococcus caeni TaxID=1348468 RepID=A0A840C3F4_9HYPH|nr:adenylate/guanylate cyclase domain-containing protein [Chelatococcus caeni]MBB4018029.1 class 3 adenylate cyclase [Chelatococcus caeni]